MLDSSLRGPIATYVGANSKPLSATAGVFSLADGRAITSVDTVPEVLFIDDFEGW